MAPDDAADLITEVEQERRLPILNLLPEPQQHKVRSLLAYNPETAGGRINLADAFQVARLPEYREVIALDQHGFTIGYEDLIASRDRGDQEALGQSRPAKGLVGDG